MVAAGARAPGARPSRPPDRGVALIAFDARKAGAQMPHGSGIYVRCLLDALRRSPQSAHELWAIEEGGAGPEMFWEQVTLPRLLRRRGAALVHAPDSFLPLRRSCPAVLTVHDLAFEAMPEDMPGRTGWKYRTLVPRCARSAQAVICPSRFTADDVVARCRVLPERIRVIAEAPALATADEPAPAGPYLLSAGDLRPKKNLPILIEAYRELRRDGLEHRLILTGSDQGIGPALREMAGGEPVELTGFVPDARLDALIRGADAVVVPSLYEGFGLIVLEAMARGRPVVLARAGALPEVGGDAAAYFDGGDAGALAAAIRRVVDDPAEQRRLGEAGQARVAEFTWEKAAAATVAVYEEVLA
jgi:glycosyltransferase involved in cell wall biosynthesis